MPRDEAELHVELLQRELALRDSAAGSSARGVAHEGHFIGAEWRRLDFALKWRRMPTYKASPRGLRVAGASWGYDEI